MKRKKYRLFSDYTSVSRGERTVLKNLDLINDDDKVHSWVRLAPRLRDREITQNGAKCLVLLELELDEPRMDLVRRLVSYISYSGKERTMEEIEKLLNEPDDKS